MHMRARERRPDRLAGLHVRTGSMHPSLSARQLTQANFSAFVMRIRYAIGIPLSRTIEATRAFGAITCETNYQGVHS